MPLTFKPFYIHACRNRRRTDSFKLRQQPHGFTVYVTPSQHERHVDIQVALCHYDDEFSRAKGREAANFAMARSINTRDLPYELVKLKAKLQGCNPKHWHGAYDYVLRYVV